MCRGVRREKNMKKFLGDFYIIILSIVCAVGISYLVFGNKNKTPEITEEHTYKVVSAEHYIGVEKGLFGRVIGQQRKWKFTYVDEDGNSHEIDEFANERYGLTQVYYGAENKYVERKVNSKTYKILYVTMGTAIP